MGKNLNYYEILEVARNASPAVIRAAYKTLMQRCHPDKRRNSDADQEQVLLIRRAYDVLSDPDRRRAYDELLAAETRSKQGEPHQPPATVASTNDKVPNSSSAIGGAILIAAGTILAVVLMLELSDSGLAPSSRPLDSSPNEGADSAAVSVVQATELNGSDDASPLSPYGYWWGTIDPARRLPNFAESFRVALDPHHELVIPVISLAVAEPLSAEVLEKIRDHRESLIEEIRNSLSRTRYSTFVGINAEQELQWRVRAAIENVVVGREGVCSKWQRSECIGIELVYFPDGFTVTDRTIASGLK